MDKNETVCLFLCCRALIAALLLRGWTSAGEAVSVLQGELGNGRARRAKSAAQQDDESRSARPTTKLSLVPNRPRKESTGPRMAGNVKRTTSAAREESDLRIAAGEGRLEVLTRLCGW